MIEAIFAPQAKAKGLKFKIEIDKNIRPPVPPTSDSIEEGNDGRRGSLSILLDDND